MNKTKKSVGLILTILLILFVAGCNSIDAYANNEVDNEVDNEVINEVINETHKIKEKQKVYELIFQHVEYDNNMIYVMYAMEYTLLLIEKYNSGFDKYETWIVIEQSINIYHYINKDDGYEEYRETISQPMSMMYHNGNMLSAVDWYIARINSSNYYELISNKIIEDRGEYEYEIQIL